MEIYTHSMGEESRDTERASLITSANLERISHE